MKLRHDFVSNSSSCSFFVHLQSKKDVEEFKKLFSMLQSKNVKMEVFANAELADCHAEGCILDESQVNGKLLAPDCFVLCDVGEDHDSWYEHRYNDMCSVFDECIYKFKFYEDSWAHMTRGKPLPIE